MTLRFYDQSKILLYIRQFEAKEPVFLEIDPSMACNQACVWCRYAHNQDGMLSYDFMLKKLAKYPKVKGVRITGGGEPLMNHDTIPFIQECYKRGITVGIETNGSLLNDESIEIIARCCRYCRISLDAGSIFTYEKLHKSNCFERVVDNIKKLHQWKVRELGVSYLVISKNLDDINLLTKLALPVDYIHFKPLIKGTDDETRKQAVKVIETNPYFKTLPTRYDRLIQDDVCNNKLVCRISELIRRIGGDKKEYVCCEWVYDARFDRDIWNGDTSKCLTCRYNGYNEILEAYYSNNLCRELL